MFVIQSAYLIVFLFNSNIRENASIVRVCFVVVAVVFLLLFFCVFFCCFICAFFS